MTKAAGEGAFKALVNVLKHPATIGTLGGAALGGGLGYLAAKDKEDPSLRRRGALVGAVTGAALGALGGAVASSGSTPMEVDRVADLANSQGIVYGHQVGLAEGLEAGITQGHADTILKWPTGIPLTEAAKIHMLRELLRK